MSSSRTSSNNRVFWLIAGATTMTAAGLGTIAWPAVSSWRTAEAATIVRNAGTGADGQTAYRVAYVLDPENDRAAANVAATRLAADNLEGARQAVLTAGSGKLADRVRVYVAVEGGNDRAALAAAERLIAGETSDQDVMAASLAFGVGGKGSDNGDLAARVASQEAAGRVKRALAGKVTLAQELYDDGLYGASERVLNPVASSPVRNELLAKLKERTGTHEALITASNLYRGSIKLDPARYEARERLIAVLERLGEHEAAQNEEVKLARLKEGRP